MSKKKFMLHRITDEDAHYLADDTYSNYDQLKGGNCYLLVNKKSEIYMVDGRILIYQVPEAPYYHLEPRNEEKRRFLEAVEACAYFRGYANKHDVKYKTPTIAELLYELEDHEIEIDDNCDYTTVITRSTQIQNKEVENYILYAMDSYEVLAELQRNLPTLALFIEEGLENNPEVEEYEEDLEDEEWEDDEDEEEEEEEEYEDGLF